MSALTDALARLATFYNSNPVSGSNPGGMGNGGHKINFPAAMADFALVATAVNDAEVNGSQVADDAAQVALDRIAVAADRAAVEQVAVPGFGAKSTVASAATTNIGAAASRFVEITGTTTITSLGSGAATSNPIYVIRFTGILVLTHHAANLVCPGGTSIITAAGDMAMVQYLGSGQWNVLLYHRASGLPVVNSAFGAEVTLASATTTSLGSQASQLISITGSATISGFGGTASLARPNYLLRFAGTPTLTDSAALVLPGGANIVAAAGDVALVQYLGGSNWRVLHYTRANGRPLPAAFASNPEVAAGAVDDKPVSPAGLASLLASSILAGLVKLATEAQVLGDVEAEAVITPAVLALRTALTTRRGLVALSTNAQAQAGSDATTALTPAALFSFARTMSANNGSMRVPGTDIIVKWGLSALTGNDRSFAFASSFPNACYGVVGNTYGRQISSAEGYNYVGTRSVTGFTYCAEVAGTGFFFIAIGN